ncbi:hypothetical protein [Sulfitobacter sp. R18_1]|uniref:hypothetical protein n=1 Tax=Sulfitobacter sp. R18_1 TaxID=2821104 RepID=UPI001AD977E3|nr:hypothetical protein [Sulfitobacter sp. R18_1]MBO9428370.1 hypothetical protein [Sulfitobacter sp. R18_1]
MPFDVADVATPSTDLMIEEIARLEDEAFQSEKKLREITNLLDHARNILACDPENYDDAKEMMTDADQMLAVCIAIGLRGPKYSGKSA